MSINIARLTLITDMVNMFVEARIPGYFGHADDRSGCTHLIERTCIARFPV